MAAAFAATLLLKPWCPGLVGGLLIYVLYVAMLAYAVALIVRARPRAQAPQA